MAKKGKAKFGTTGGGTGDGTSLGIAAKTGISYVTMLAAAILCFAILVAYSLGQSSQESGWQRPNGNSVRRYKAGHCGIPILDAESFSKAKFQESFLERSPVLVRGLTAKQAADKRWDQSSFIVDFGSLDGSKTVPLSTVQFGTPTRHRNKNVVPLQKYLEDMKNPINGTPPLLLDRSHGELGKRVIKVHGIPGPFGSMFQGEETLPILSLGGSGAGLSLHQHAQTWLSLLRGRKMWFLMAPEALQGHKAYSTLNMKPAAEWPQAILGSVLSEGNDIHVCEQLAGDVIYVPTLWYHGTENDGDVLGIGQQQMDMFPKSTGGISGALTRYPSSATVKDRMANDIIFSAEKSLKEKADALVDIDAAIALEPLNFHRRVLAVKARGAVVQSRGADMDEVVKVLTEGWQEIEDLASESASQGLLSKQQLSALFARLFNEASSILPPGEQLPYHFREKAIEADLQTFNGFEKRDSP